jgi:hypothetical protein
VLRPRIGALLALVLAALPAPSRAALTLTVEFVDTATNVFGIDYPASGNAAPYGTLFLVNESRPGSPISCPTAAVHGSAFPRFQATSCTIQRDDWAPGDTITVRAPVTVFNGTGDDPNPYCLVDFGGFGPEGLCTGNGTPDGGVRTCSFTAVAAGTVKVAWVVTNTGHGESGVCPQRPPSTPHPIQFTPVGTTPSPR